MTLAVPAGDNLTYQEILRSVGAWLDMRNYQTVQISGDTDCLIVEALPSTATIYDEPERLVLTDERLQRFCEASRQNRSPKPTVSPPKRSHLKLVVFEPANLEAVEK